MSDGIEIVTDQTKEEWYAALVEDCKAIITEAVFNSRWALVEGYHQLGERIVTDENYQWHAKGNMSYLQGLANNLSISDRTIYYAVQFYEKYPDLDIVPEGKNISWNKIITKYLPEPKTETPALPAGKYQVIYADPPWKYEEHGVSVSELPGNSYGTTIRHYQSMTIEELCALPVRGLVADDAVLFIWVTSPKLNQVWDIIEAWGFEYKTSFIWDKVKHNFGYYNSVRHELLLVCGRGSSTPEIFKLFDSVQVIERAEHSEKPVEFRKIIEELYPTWAKLELFARNEVPGWSVWGDEV